MPLLDDPTLAEYVRRALEAQTGPVAPDPDLKAAQEADRQATREAQLAAGMQQAASLIRNQPERIAPVAPVDTAMRDWVMGQKAADAQRQRATAPLDILGKFATADAEERRRAADAEARKTEHAEDRKFRAEEAEKDRKFRAEEAEKDRKFRAREGARGRAAGVATGHAAMADVAERKRKMLSDAQLKIVAQYDTGLDNLRFLLREKKGIDTGPAAAARNKVASLLGVDDPKVSAFRAAVGDSLATYIRSLSGAAVSDRERAFLLQNVPKLEDNDQVFEAKIRTVMDRLERLRAIEIDLFGKQGKDVSEFQAGPSEAPAPVAAPGGKVVVIWKGKRKEIPAERLEEALAAGATRAE